MKNRLLLAVLCGLLLSSCSSNEQENPPIENNENVNIDSEVEENPNEKTEENTDEKTEENIDEKTGQNEDDKKNESESESYTSFIKMTGNTFEEYQSKRAQLSNDSKFQGNVDNLERYIKSNLDSSADQRLTGLTFDGFVQSLDADKDELYVSLGSSSSDGSMTWKSTIKILKVEITVKNYYKTYSYGDVSGVSVDNYAHFILDNTDYSLELTNSIVPEPKTFSKTYDNGTNSFTIASLNGRVLIESFSITWEK